jgi:hypothetical protein
MPTKTLLKLKLFYFLFYFYFSFYRFRPKKLLFYPSFFDSFNNINIFSSGTHFYFILNFYSKLFLSFSTEVNFLLTPFFGKIKSHKPFVFSMFRFKTKYHQLLIMYLGSGRTSTSSHSTPYSKSKKVFLILVSSGFLLIYYG